MNDIQSVLTPTQAAKFIMWVTNNAACMQMLNNLWSTSWNLDGTEPPPPVASNTTPLNTPIKKEDPQKN